MPTFRQDNKLGDSVPLIKTPDIGDKQVTERKLADGSVTSSKLSTEIANMLSLLTTRISAFKVADNLSSLPTEENTIGWLVDNHLYVYVGNGSTPESGMYQDCGELRGPQGIQGEQGLSGLNGKSAYDIWTEQPGNEDKSEIDFLEFTRGSKGDKGEQGERGYDISNIEQLVKSTEDGGKNIIRVTRSDGWSKVFEIFNGSKGSKGDKGTSIVKLEQTRKTTESSGLNTIEATLGDGTKESFEIYNGAKGEQGNKGEKGDKGDQGEIGPQGNSGIADASNKVLVNDAITGGETDFLSAEVGKLGILTYDCSKGGSVTHATLQDAINSVPTTFQKVGLTITYKSGNTIYSYTLKANTWSADPANWFSVEDKLNDLSERDLRAQLINGVSIKDINGENIETFVHSSGSLQKVNGFAGKKFKVQPNKRYYIHSTVKNNPNVLIFGLYLNDNIINRGPLTTESSTCILDTHELNCNTLYVSSTEDKLSEVYVEEFTTNATTNEDGINKINIVAENKDIVDGYMQKELTFRNSYNDSIINTNGYKVSANGFVVLEYDISTASNLIIKNGVNSEYSLLWSIFDNKGLLQKGQNSKGNIIDYVTPKGEYLLTCCRIEDVNKVHVYNICPTSLIEPDISFLVSSETQEGSFIDPSSGQVSKNSDFLVKSYPISQQQGTIKIPFSYEKARCLGYSFSNENDIIEYGDTNRNEFKIPTGATSFSMSYRGEKRNTILQFYERNVSSVTKLKDSNYRRKIEINLTDSEEEIADKLFFAFYLGNCDVFWEHGTYSFNNVFEYIHNKYNESNNNELPLGGNCRYYFNDSTIIGNKQSTDENIMNNESLFGVLRQSTSFEINDATFVANGLVYVVHDDAGGNQRHYLHKYNNIKMQYISKDFTNDIRKCVGGGMGKDGHVIFNNCYFETDHQFAIKWHGNSANSDDSKIKIEIINSILKNAIGFETLPENNTGELELKFNYINDSGYINDGWKVLDIGNIKK